MCVCVCVWERERERERRNLYRCEIWTEQLGKLNPCLCFNDYFVSFQLNFISTQQTSLQVLYCARPQAKLNKKGPDFKELRPWLKDYPYWMNKQTNKCHPLFLRMWIPQFPAQRGGLQGLCHALSCLIWSIQKFNSIFKWTQHT
jgi:hypothetical protein